MLEDKRMLFTKKYGHHSMETANCYFLEGVKSGLDNGGIVGAVFWTSIRLLTL